jgi:hypothetical protein
MPHTSYEVHVLADMTFMSTGHLNDITACLDVARGRSLLQFHPNGIERGVMVRLRVKEIAKQRGISKKAPIQYVG